MADVSREVRRLALPAILHSLLQTLVFVVDRVMLGRHGDMSLAALQLGGSIEWSIWSVFAAFEVGTIARVGRHVGAGDAPRARVAAWLSIAIAGGVGSAVALATPLVLGALPLMAPSASPAVLAEARGYLGATMAASPLVFVALTAVAVLQAGGDTKTPLLIGVFANVLHVASNRALILGLGPVPALGARGAGISTAIAFGVQAVLATAALVSRRRVVSLRRPPPEGALPAATPPVGEEARLLARIALPAFAERVLYHVGYTGYVFIIARLGDAAMAANQSLISVEAVCFLSGDGFGIAAAALVAQKLGAKDEDGAARAARVATRDAMFALSAFGVVAFVLRDVILPVFSRDASVVALGRAAMPVLCAAQPFMAMGIVLSQALRGAGRTRDALTVSVAGAVVVRLAATWLLAVTLGLGLVGVWLGSTLDWVARCVWLAVLGRRRTSARL